ncbi:hypothetical protein BD410DRAFT_830628 [Rickenella mellea]|uniref:Uncharacterized protein n=1 Tax=Rickenella mellea TaxID=50990 RepID=A0A4Y7PUT8_9AGAM|nr:hypothetical protein BD410DRAFT_830628 [Rickenella mellea]
MTSAFGCPDPKGTLYARWTSLLSPRMGQVVSCSVNGVLFYQPGSSSVHLCALARGSEDVHRKDRTPPTNITLHGHTPIFACKPPRSIICPENGLQLHHDIYARSFPPPRIVYCVLSSQHRKKYSRNVE